MLALWLALCASVAHAQWDLAWSDEFFSQDRGFRHSLPNPDYWSYFHGKDGGGNEELQYYSEGLANAWVEDGKLVIEARKEHAHGKEFTSARLITMGKIAWLYGRLEVRAKLPSARGTWPAIWMMPEQGRYGDLDWPDNGEIDIMEHVGFDPGYVHSNLHSHSLNWWNRNNPTGMTYVPDFDTAFHTYAIEWDPMQISFFVDNLRTLQFANPGLGWETWPFDQPFFLILNVAVGGGWGGMQGVDEAAFPQRMEVDYVRFYRSAGGG